MKANSIYFHPSTVTMVVPCHILRLITYNKNLLEPRYACSIPYSFTHPLITPTINPFFSTSATSLFYFLQKTPIDLNCCPGPPKCYFRLINTLKTKAFKFLYQHVIFIQFFLIANAKKTAGTFFIHSLTYKKLHVSSILPARICSI